MNEADKARAQQQAAEQFVRANLPDLCRELVEFDQNGLFGDGKAHQLRVMCGFAGASAQSLAIGMVEAAAVKDVATRAPISGQELLRAMDEWGAAGFVVTERSVEFLNFFITERADAFHWRQSKDAG